MVRPHTSHVERNDRSFAGDIDEMPKHTVKRAVYVEKCASGDSGRRMRIEGMARIHTVPQTLYTSVQLDAYGKKEVPVRAPLFG